MQAASEQTENQPMTMAPTVQESGASPAPAPHSDDWVQGYREGFAFGFKEGYMHSKEPEVTEPAPSPAPAPTPAPTPAPMTGGRSQTRRRRKKFF